MAVVCAWFPSSEAAATAEAEVRDAHGRGGRCLTQIHVRRPLDGNALPEPATEFARNIAMAMAGGGVFMAIVGGVAGFFDLMLGMTTGMGIGLGFVTGLLMGLVGAMQAGTRRAKPGLRDLEAKLERGGAIVIVELDGRHTGDVVTRMESHGADGVEQY
jgi:hypothetical protein